jgi:hypothetical protein
MPLIPPERSLFGRRLQGVRGGEGWDASSLPEQLISALEARALWARYGL